MIEVGRRAPAPDRAPRSTSSGAAGSPRCCSRAAPSSPGAFLDAGEIDELRLFIAPLVLGAGRPLLAGAARAEIADGERLLALEWERSGEDLLVRGRLREW